MLTDFARILHEFSSKFHFVRRTEIENSVLGPEDKGILDWEYRLLLNSTHRKLLSSKLNKLFPKPSRELLSPRMECAVCFDGKAIVEL